MPSAMITAAICTFNRHELLREAVEGILEQNLDRRLFKVLIVDNSTDRAAADSFYRSARFDPIVSVIWSDPPGLSRARNRAAGACGTSYIAYLDDDARPHPSWLSGLLYGFGHSPKVAAVGGPIAPLWSKGRPSWLPQKHLSMLAVLDPFDCDRDLGAHQYVFGANMAFKVEQLQAIGGFPEQIGRIGSISLLSGEEIQVQDALRAAGYVVRFVKSASIRHFVHENRLRRNWMRSRMIWQVASEQLQQPPVVPRDWALAEIKRLAKIDPDVRAAARLFFKQAEEAEFEVQLDAIRHFSTLLMDAHQNSEPIMEADDLRSSPATDQLDGYAQATGRYAPSAAGASNAEFLFVEGLPGHAYLYELFGRLDGAQLLTYSSYEASNSEPTGRANFKSSLEYIWRSIGRRVKAVFFLTLDQPLYGPSAEEFFRFLRACPAPIFGILHRMPNSPLQIEAVRSLDDLAAGVCFLSETMMEHARSTLGLRRAYYLPLHPMTSAFAMAPRAREKARAKMGIRHEQCAFAVIGEARRGKGIGLLLSALDRIPAGERERMFFIFAGKATDHFNEEVQLALINSRTLGFTDLRRHSVTSAYALLTDREYGQYIAGTDIGLLLYQHEQRKCMSGVLGDYVWANRKVIATFDSYTGAEVHKHDLGLTLKDETSSTLAATLVEALCILSVPISPKAKEYRERIAPCAVLAELRQLIDRSDTGRELQNCGGKGPNGANLESK